MINYSYIQKSIDFYELNGFVHVESPWTVTPQISDITKPKNIFQTVTPCFRYEEFDSLHTKYFIKNELIKTDFVDKHHLMKMIYCAQNFFQSIGLAPDIGYALIYKEIKLGSYGIRECDFLKWIYETGLAKPRFSSTLKKYGLS